MDFNVIIARSGEKYGIDPPFTPEGGEFPPRQISILCRLLQHYIDDPTEANFRFYIEQKIKFIIGGG
jgi:hypothetical protein